ncbi:MAG: anaerobic ribonucleoside triphosphate reductase [Oscillospiraceae bacterium]|nr:anaerobic ribonucleoside triphosphate reductase [Oscillospiraceae bacterium]
MKQENANSTRKSKENEAYTAAKYTENQATSVQKAQGKSCINGIKKRDGRKAPFDKSKITDAIFSAAQAAGGNDRAMAESLAELVVERLEKIVAERLAKLASGELKKEDAQQPADYPQVEEIQDVVERVLMDNGHYRTAKKYVLYRNDRSIQRDKNSSLMKTLESIATKEARCSDLKRENANIDAEAPMGAMLKYGQESFKEYNRLFLLAPEHSEAHRDGDIHIHDLDFYALTTTCCQIDIIKLFKNGFGTGHGFLREPNDIASYSALACIAIQANQNDQHGGQSIPNFDYGMALGVAKTYARHYRRNLAKALDMLHGIDDAEEKIAKWAEDIGKKPVLANDNGYCDAELKHLTKEFKLSVDDAQKCQQIAVKHSYKETERSTYQAMEALVHNLNTMQSRAGAQTPFSSINYGLDTSPEGRMVIRSVLLSTERGLGRNETPIFPIQIFRVKKGVSYDEGDPNYDLFKLACRVSAKRLFPNFSFMDAPFNAEYYKEGDYDTEVAYMGCRTRVIGNVYDKTRETTGGRGNLSFTSINLPRIAIKASQIRAVDESEKIGEFFNELNRKIDLCIAQLLKRFEVQAKRRVRNYPFLMGQGLWLDADKLKEKDKVEEILKHGTLSVGFIGLAEALTALIGEHHGESEKAQNLGMSIISHMRERMDAQAEKSGLNFSLLATPGEGLSGRFIRIDMKKYGVILGVTDKEYYTNGFHVPVGYKISAFDKIRIEAPYHAMTNAGHISYVEMDGDPTQNLEAFEKIIRCMADSGMGYGSINHPVDRDPVCGYTGIINEECPQCGRMENDGNENFARIRRITGYLVGTLERFNDAKQAEEKDRVKHI